MHCNPVPRRRHRAEPRAKVLAAGNERGASIAAVALSHSLNANLVRKWLVSRSLKRTGIQARVAAMASAFTAVPAPAAAPLGAADVRFLPIELVAPARTTRAKSTGHGAADASMTTAHSNACFPPANLDSRMPGWGRQRQFG